MQIDDHDTIAAVSTPPGEGGIAVIRLSGKKAVSIADLMFHGKNLHQPFESHHAYHGWIFDEEKPLDEVVVTIFKGPNSFTGEDVVEISGHGGLFVSRTILESAIKNGARPAQPGEFTRRAFVNGRIDLTQAEAIADIIHAKTEISRKVALSQLQGHLSGRIVKIKEKLIHACSLLELELDFSGEDVEFVSKKELSDLLISIQQEILQFIQTFDRGRILREGLRAAIVGRPNVGKSSVLNALLEKERAIVAEQPGTTRDTIECVMDLNGLLLTILDTAGIRKTKDPVEIEGVKRAEKALQESDFVLLILDGSQRLQKEDQNIIQNLNDQKKTVLAVINKTDLPGRLDQGEIRKILKTDNCVEISATKKRNINVLIDKLHQAILSNGTSNQEEIVLTNIRHRNSLSMTQQKLVHAEESLQQGASQEFVAMDIRGAMDSLEEIMGRTTPDDVLEHIFSKFCIGK
jgi:tRNA modification GTPase